MLQNIDFYYFSPTGGTKKAGEAIAAAFGESVNAVNLAKKTVDSPASDVVVVAVPVFGGRIPALVSERIRLLRFRMSWIRNWACSEMFAGKMNFLKHHADKGSSSSSVVGDEGRFL